MAFKLTTSEREERAFLAEKLSDSGEEFTAAIERFNETVREAWLHIIEAQARYNAVVEESEAFVSRIYEPHLAAYEAKTERWQESEAGEKVSVWLEEWDTELDTIDLEPPDPIEADETEENYQRFKALPDEA
jgi:hypothetical protein